MSPLVSLIVPVYGVAAYIEDCARSLLGQTYPEVEFIFIDDGSPDDSVERLRALVGREFPARADRVRILSKANEGQSLARRDGLACATGKYVLMVDSDDTLEPHAVERLVARAEEEGADVVVFDFWKEYASYRRRDSEKASSIADTDLFRKRLYTYASYGYVWNKFLLRSLCEGLFFPRYSMHEDIVFCTQVLYRARRVVQLREPLYHYNRANTTSATRAAKSLRRSRSARNMMDFYRHFQGAADSPLRGVEDEVILRAAWVGYTRDRSLFADYPELASLARAFPVRCGRFVNVFQQLILRRFLRKLA